MAYFEKNVPEQLLSDGDNLTRAKNIYAFIKDRYTWNGEYGIYDKTRVKEAFEERKGNVSEINMSLINLLNAANIKADLLLLSTRSEGLPKKTHPVMSDFNYAVAKAQIDGKDYILDATDKYNPFGMLPFRALNHYGRVMDFKNDSYWYDLKPEENNRVQVRIYLKFDPVEQKAAGIMDILTMGYDAVNKNRSLDQYSKEAYLDEVEKDMTDNFKITAYELSDERSDEKKVSERFGFEVGNILKGDMVYLNPFLFQFFDENPFLMESRSYPIDFGYPRNYKYQININVPEGYEVQELPKDQIVKLGENLAILQFYHQQENSQIGIFFELALKSSFIAAEDYGSLKNLFKDVTDIQKNALVVLKKK